MLFSKSRIKNLDKTDSKIREAVDRLAMNGDNTFKTVSSRKFQVEHQRILA